MKRSEMIKHIKACFRAHPQMLKYQNGEISLGRAAEDLSNIILNSIEEKGMLPPKSLDTVTLKKGLVRGYTMMFEWDDEDL